MAFEWIGFIYLIDLFGDLCHSFVNSLSYIVYIVGCESTHVDTPRLQQVNMELFDHESHLGFCKEQEKKGRY